uniref:Nucleolar protein 8-like n=1 Tax=Saccoglossus kowalevskii TaxID=10224 RepID=A0ABM0GXH7_SACKO|nr:PREDICTED: nucleolar protein 8-like [Saccoglossus kowalevskii]
MISDEKSASVAANAVEIKSKKLTKERKSKIFEHLDSDCEQQNDNSVKTSIMKDSLKNCESRNQVKETEENMSILDCEKSAHKSEVKQSTKVNKAKKVRKPAAVRKMEAKLKIKHKNDNEKRLESIREKQRSTQKQKSAIQDALASVDSNKKMGQYIVFDSDEESESESEPQPQPQPQPESESESESTGTIDLKDTDAVSAGDAEDLKKTKKTKDALTLFDSDSSSNDDDDDDDDSDEDRFQIKPQFEGKSGGKLMSLQSRFGMDERFKIDERFQESDEEDKSEKMKNKEDSDSDATENEDYDLVKEKASQLSILQDIVGTKALLKFSAKSKGSFKDMASLHFDPTRKDHSEFETKIKDERLKKKDKKSEKKKDEEDPPEVTKDKYFEVSEEIKDGFSAEKPFSFSFLPDDGQQTGDKMETEYTTSSVSKSPWQPKLFRYDSTDEEIEEDDPIDETVSKQHSNETEDKSQNVEDKTSRPTFFFHLNDPRLIEGPKLFCRPSNETEITKKWKETIPLIQEDYRKRHQDALRRIKKAAKQRRGKKW